MEHNPILELEGDAEAPEKLEALYRSDAEGFSEHLPGALALRPGSLLLRAWAARLAPARSTGGSRLELWFMIALALLSGLFIKLPDILPRITEEFYPRNTALGPLGALAVYLLHARGWPRRASAAVLAMLGALALYLNLLPDIDADQAILALVHAPFVLWCVAALAFAGEVRPGVEARRGWIRFFGELVVFSGLLSLGGAVLLYLTHKLFGLFGGYQDWIIEWMLPMGATAIPVVAAWAVLRGSAGGRVMPLLARIFAPLFLVLLCLYLFRLACDVGKLFNDRDTLLVYNVILLSVLGLCVFSLSGQGSGQGRDASRNRWLHALLAMLAVLTVVFDALGLAAIVNRILEMGVTPNRLAVLGANVVVLGNLLLLVRGFAAILRGRVPPSELEHITARYLPVLAGWSFFVLAVFPWLF
ncbi:MAG: hypothetical protein AB7D51_12215 [Desulfovibrionaceae bacterium]